MSRKKDIEAKKLKAATLLSQGLKQSEVARILGISTRTLQRWEKESGFKQVKNDVAYAFVDATVQSTKTLVSDCEPIFTYQDRIRLISQEFRRLELATDICEKRLIDTNDLRAALVLIKLTECKCKLLNLNLPGSDATNALMNLASLGAVDEKLLDTVVESSRQLLLNQ